jgi:hypothetical protein
VIVKAPYKPYPHQEIFHSWQPDAGKLLIKGIVTGYGGGKTHAGVREMIKLAILNAPLPCLYVEPTYGMIQDILLPAFDEVLTEWGWHYTYNKSSKVLIITKPNAVLWFRSGDNPDSLKGPNIAAAAIDEPFIQSRGVYKQVIARIRHPRARRRVLLLTGTPEGLGWGHEELEGKTELTGTQTFERNGETVAVNVHEGESIKWVQTSSMMNEALETDYFDRLRSSHTDLEVGSYIQGLFQNLNQGRVYYGYERVKNDHEIELDYSLPVFVCCDFNASEKPMSWCIGQEREQGTMIRYALWKSYTNTPEMCVYLEEVLKRLNGQLPNVLYFYGDYSGNSPHSSSTQTDWQQIRNHFEPLLAKGNCVINTKPCKSVRMGVGAVNTRLCNAKGERKLFIFPGIDTDHLRKDFEQVTWHIDGTREDQKDVMRTHAASAVRYYCDFIHPVMGRPVYGGV